MFKARRSIRCTMTMIVERALKFRSEYLRTESRTSTRKELKSGELRLAQSVANNLAGEILRAKYHLPMKNSMEISATALLS